MLYLNIPKWNMNCKFYFNSVAFILHIDYTLTMIEYNDNGTLVQDGSDCEPEEILVLDIDYIELNND